MKKNLFIGLLFMSFITACFTSCSNDEVVSGNNNYGKGVTINASIDEPTSRVAFKEDDTKLKMYWKNAADVEKFSLFYTDAAEANYMFVKSAITADAQNASFTCGTVPTIPAGKTIYAVYPGHDAHKANMLQTVLDLREQPGIEATTTSTEANVGDFNLMVAKTTIPETGLKDASFTFEHKVALVKVTLIFKLDLINKVKKISISSPDIHNFSVYDILTDEWFLSDDFKGSVSAISDTGFTMVDNKITVWLAVFPESIKNVTLTAYAGSDTYSVKMGDITFEANKVYTVNNIFSGKQNFKPEYTLNDYFRWDAVDCVTGSNYSQNFTNLGPATQSCKYAPSLEDCKKYLGAGVYYDTGIDNADGHQQTYIVEGEEYHVGLWMKKMKYIGDVVGVSQVGNGQNDELFHTGRPKENEINQYFFLPAAGWINAPTYSNHISAEGTLGYYWTSSLVDDDNTRSHSLFFCYNYADVSGIYRSYGYPIFSFE